MSESALLQTQNEHLIKEKTQLTNALEDQNATITALDQCVNEYLRANVQLRSLGIKLERKFGNANKEIEQLKARIESLEKGRLELLAKYEPVKNDEKKLSGVK